MGYVEEYLANEAQNGAGKTVRDQTSTFPGFPRLLESPGFFSLKFQDLESPGKISLENAHFSTGSN